MQWALHPLVMLAAALCAVVALAYARNRPGRALDEIEEAVDRVRRGEPGVRLEPATWGRDARFISRFNAALAEIEAGSYDWDHAAPEESAMFEALRSRYRVEDPGGMMFVAVVEVERFATLRRSIGYGLATQVLSRLSERVVEAIATAEIGRVGRVGFEFAFKAGSAGEAQFRLMEAIASLERRLEFGEYSFDLSVTIGFADADASSIRDELFDQAAAAVAAARVERVKVCFADAQVLAQNSLADLELMRALPTALAAGEVELHYQPQLDARSNTIPSAEALLRWTRPGQGSVPAARFVALAEDTGAIGGLTEWVLGRALADQKRLAQAGHAIRIDINLSGHLIADRGFTETAMRLIGEAGGQIGFEVTEASVLADPDAALANLHDFAQAGIRIAIDDFGTGLSSLTQLRRLPASELKIDQQLVGSLSEGQRDPLVVRASVDLAHALDMEATAEGVDDAMALSLLRVMGCDLLQGYFISPPLPAADLAAFLSDAAQIKRLSDDGDTGDWPLAGNG